MVEEFEKQTQLGIEGFETQKERSVKIEPSLHYYKYFKIWFMLFRFMLVVGCVDEFNRFEVLESTLVLHGLV